MPDEPNTFRDMPQWPEDAEDLPDDGPPKTEYRWFYILGAVGVGGGLLTGFAGAQELGLGFLPCSVIGSGVLFALLGYCIDRVSWGGK